MKVGIIGGGQLGMYLALAANQIGYQSIVYDQSSEVSAAKICDKFIEGDFNDQAKLEEFCKLCDVITFEFENINNEIIEYLSAKYNIVQGAKLLKISASRLNEKNLAKELDIKTIPWQYIKDGNTKIELNYPYLLKTVSLGYDGKGQYLIENAEDLKQVDFSKAYLAEEKLDFDYEISLIAVRAINEQVVMYQPFYNIHHKGILHMTLLNEVPQEVEIQAQEIITKIIKSQNVYGILCVEFFVKDNVVYFNEIAPRPHNSGHITMDTHYTSQYQNHIRAICGFNLGNTLKKCDGFMVNILGQDVDKVEGIMQRYGQNINLYDYKKSARENRKVGHLVDYDLNHIDYFLNDFR